MAGLLNEEAGGEFADFPGEPYWILIDPDWSDLPIKLGVRRHNIGLVVPTSSPNEMLDMAYEKSGLGYHPTRFVLGQQVLRAPNLVHRLLPIYIVSILIINLWFPTYAA